MEPLVNFTSWKDCYHKNEWLLYPMQMVQNYIQVKFFKTLQSMIGKFVWKYKRPRFKLDKLQLLVAEGGLALPNIMYYHWASQIRYIAEWIKNDPNSTYLDLESTGCVTGISDLPFIHNAITQKGMKENEIIRNTLKTWHQIRKHFRIIDQYSILAPIVCNPDFVPSCSDIGYKNWNDVGVNKLQD